MVTEFEDTESDEDNDAKYLMSAEDIPENLEKYWRRRHLIFRSFNHIYMTQELLYSVTPESIAIFLAKFVKSCNPNIRTVADIFCGGGGNTIQFARWFDKTIGFDFAQDSLICTAHNCKVYDVYDKVTLYQGDWSEAVESGFNRKLSENVDFVFGSPPWGGPQYANSKVYDLNFLQPLPFKQLLKSFLDISENVGLFLPRNSDLRQLSSITRELLGPNAKCRLLLVHIKGFLKGIIALWGDCFLPENYHKLLEPNVEDNEHDSKDAK